MLKNNDLDSQKVGLVLSGGGARGGYQSGAFQAIVQIAQDIGIPNPFKVFTGSSVGAINVAFLSAHAGNQRGAARRLVQMWSSLHTYDIYEANLAAVMASTGRALASLSTGGLIKDKRGLAYLLETTPLKNLISRMLPVDNIQQNIDRGSLHGIALKALDYSTGMSTTFFQGHPSIHPWMRSQRLAERTNISVEHVLASSAIPMVFPAVMIGDRYYGDGSIRNFTPLSPAIKMGANKLMVITAKQRLGSIQQPARRDPTAARISSILLNSLLMDNIDIDVERLTRINNTIQHLDGGYETPLKPIKVLLIQPDQDLAKIAMDYAHLIPKSIRFFLQGSGGTRDSSDVISNILFESEFLKHIINIGYEDCLKRRDEIEAFFLED